MADKRISQLIERTDIANNDVLPIVASGATTTNKVTVSTLQDWMQDNLDVGVTSVGLSVPSAFSVSGSPVTTSGNITISGAGTTAQYIRGDGSLADFPSISGGGSSVSYYLNGSVSQGTIGGVAYRELSKSPILGSGTDFTINADGYIASFITDAGDPGLLQIPGGNWNFETYFQASSGGGSPTFYVELYKVSAAGTATLIASSSGSPELIAFGTNITPYFSSLAVPTTTLALTDRLAIRYYVTHSGRTITLHTENSNLCQIITTFTTGLTALNGLTAQVQNFATGTSGTDFNISSASTTHTFNLPDASASNRGAVTTGTQTFAGYKIFNGTIGANVDIQLATQGTALNTFIKNINATGQTSIGSNGFGFNNANNIYFSGSSKGGGIFAFSNTGNQTYTLQDASGTLAFTSQIPSNIVTDGGVGTADRVPKFTGPGVLTNSAIADQTNEVNILKRVSVSVSSHQIVLTPSLGGTSNRIETTNLPLELVTTGSAIRLAAGGATPQFTLSSAGLVTLTGALNGTSAVFSSTTEASNSSTASVVLAGGLGVAKNIRTSQNIIAEGVAGTIATLNGGDFQVYTSGNANYSSISSPSSGNMVLKVNIAATPINALTLASTGAATFSSSVTAGGDVLLGFAANRRFGVDLNSGEYFYGISSNSNARQTRVISAAADGNLGISFETGNTYTTVTPKMTITSSGNVGIGTASPNVLGFSKALTISSSNSGIELTSADNIVQGSFSGSTNGLAISGVGENGIRFLSSSSGSATERVRITSAGNVGIGTASPARALEVLRSGSATAQIKFGDASTPKGYLGVFSNTVYLTAGGTFDSGWSTDGANGISQIVLETFNGGSAIAFSTIASNTSPTERMRITSGGFLKASNTGSYFGVSNPYHELRSNTSNDWTAFISNSSASPFALKLLFSGVSPANSGNYFIECSDTIADRFRVASNGNVTNTNGSYGSISDAKLKENITDATPKLDDLLKVKVRNYNLIGSEIKQIGVIAQELEEVFPAMIDESEDFEEVEIPQLDKEGNEVLNEEGKVVTTKERVSKGTTTKSVKYSVFVPMLIKAIQELKTEIDSLKNQIK